MGHDCWLGHRHIFRPHQGKVFSAFNAGLDLIWIMMYPKSFQTTEMC